MKPDWAREKVNKELSKIHMLTPVLSGPIVIKLLRAERARMRRIISSLFIKRNYPVEFGMDRLSQRALQWAADELRRRLR